MIKPQCSAKEVRLTKKIYYSLITIVLSVLFFELLFRVLLSFYVGPSSLFYGTTFERRSIEKTYLEETLSRERPDAVKYLYGMKQEEWNRVRDVEIHNYELKGYTKYFANQNKIDFDIETGESFKVSINNNGFRGRDFVEKKADGVIRIICLGASSTFGYFDRDDETYPFYLEEILNNKHFDNKKFEVINLGIPHLNSEEIFNLFMAEGVQLEPDIVTFYEGNNDSDPPNGWLYKSLAHAAIKKIGQYSIAAKFVDTLISQKVKILQQKMSDNEILSLKTNFIKNISNIYKECKKRNMYFVVANQQRNSTYFDRNVLKNLTYQQEVERIDNRLQNTGALVQPELAFLIHSSLMDSLKEWATENNINFVDVIEKLDKNRDVLVSWVHLSPIGNKMVAEAFAEKILENWGIPESNGNNGNTVGIIGRLSRK